jgi:steroid 5-alpha reductase family enzyme
MNGNILGYNFTMANSAIDWGARFFIGVLIFCCGMLINILSDETLIAIRKNSNQYAIPREMLYNYISCPNYFGEILEWAGFALAAGNIGALSFLVWTCANLIPRAITNHKWYKANFSEYPKERKAIFPFFL